MPGGRPSSYTKEKADIICDRMMDGESLRNICQDEDMPNKGTVMRWLASNEEFRDQYTRAREGQAEYWADEMVTIADDGTNDWMDKQNSKGEVVGVTANNEAIQRSRLRVDTRKWIAAKLLPKKYGEKIAVGGDKDMDPIKTEDMSMKEVARRLAFVFAAGKKEMDEEDESN